jgi:large subunit ribosomal protein L21
MYAIIKNGGKQYKVSEGDELSLDKMSLEAGSVVEMKEVLAVNAGELKVGAPFVEGAVVTAEVIREGRDRKVVTFKKRRRKDSKVKRGFRRDFTRVKITKIAA